MPKVSYERDNRKSKGCDEDEDKIIKGLQTNNQQTTFAHILRVKPQIKTKRWLRQVASIGYKLPLKFMNHVNCGVWCYGIERGVLM